MPHPARWPKEGRSPKAPPGACARSRTGTDGEECNMEITEVKVFPIQEEKLKAFVSIVFDQCFMVNDIKIIQGREGLFISMPSRKKKNGEFKDVAHPLNNETRRMIEEQVLAEYDRVLVERGDSPAERGERASSRPPTAEGPEPAMPLAAAEKTLE